MDKTYSHNEYCDNCGKKNNFSIPKGTTIEYFMHDRLCGYCGCLLRGNKVKFTHDRDPFMDIDSYLDRNFGLRWKDNMQDCRHSQKVEQDIANKIRVQVMGSTYIAYEPNTCEVSMRIMKGGGFFPDYADTVG